MKAIFETLGKSEIAYAKKKKKEREGRNMRSGRDRMCGVHL